MNSAYIIPVGVLDCGLRTQCLGLLQCFLLRLIDFIYIALIGSSSQSEACYQTCLDVMHEYESAHLSYHLGWVCL